MLLYMLFIDITYDERIVYDHITYDERKVNAWFFS